MRCGRCGEENREGRKFCAGCGAELGWACPDCSFVNEAGAGFCGGCGKAQPEAKPAPAAEQASASPSPEVVGERRQVAILFADLSGFTALSARLDAEDLRRLVEAFYARTEAIISLYGGSVDKHIGDAVMALFGAPVAHGDDNQRALAAALDIAATASEIAEPGGAPLAAHVGIAMGEVVAGGIGRGYTVLGDAVNLASRLVGLAGPGEVVIARRCSVSSKAGSGPSPCRRPASKVSRCRSSPGVSRGWRPRDGRPAPMSAARPTGAFWPACWRTVAEMAAGA